MRTHNNDFSYESTGNALLEFFSKAGGLREKNKSYYGGETNALELFKGAWVTDNYRSMKLAMWLRDIRGGEGNRSGFRSVINWLAQREPEWVKANLHLIPLYGRWDDLRVLNDTPCEEEAFKFWVRAIQDGHGLAAKWAPRSSKKNEERKALFNKLRRISGMSPKDFRKLLSQNTDVIESRMCSQNWQDIDYSKVPSVAMSRYNNSFKKHDTARFDQWRNGLEKGVDNEGKEVKVNAGALYPHDCLRTLYADLSDSHGGYYGFTNYRRHATTYRDSLVANAQFEALPDYIGESEQRIIAITDFSASMRATVGGKVTRMDVSMGLGLYCSDRLGKDNPFYRRFIPFSDSSRMVCWENETFSVAAQKYNDGWIGSTNIRAALDQILNAAQMFKATEEEMPNTLLIISDMQFNGPVESGTVDNATTVEAGISAWESAGYSRPRIVYWNVSGYAGSPATINHPDVALVSGFNPSLLEAVLGGTDFTPMGVLERAIAKYEVVDPTIPKGSGTKSSRKPKGGKKTTKATSKKTAKKVATKKKVAKKTTKKTTKKVKA